MSFLSINPPSAIGRSLCVSGCALMACLSVQAGEKSKVAQYTSAADIRASVAKTVNGVAAYTIKTDASTPVIVARRDGPGEVEVHLKQNDLVVAQSGKVTVLIGERVEGNREVAPNEWLGGKIIGGKSYVLAPGDVLWIPFGLGHLMTVPPGGSFSYLVVKSEAKQ
jgi:mannose-6-phosphate isomerase-like protein (cupin superfamily)